MKQHVRSLARAFLDVARQVPESQHEELCDAAFTMLCERGLGRDMCHFPRIVSLLLRQEEGIISATLATPCNDGDAHAAALSRLLSSALRKTVTIEKAVDPTLIGGATLSFGDERFDWSLLRALENAQTVLLS